MAAKEDIGMIDTKQSVASTQLNGVIENKEQENPKHEDKKKDMGHKPEFEIAYDSYS